jgi:hypothetical protein
MDPTDMDMPAMPAMMDTTMDDSMVDLFGEAGDSLTVTPMPMPLPGPLLLRISEMQGCGCCTCVPPFSSC